jgi:YidC/Oxa1 family membrane protein insertase
MFKIIIKYFIYYPLTSISYWQSIFNVIKYKLSYERKDYIVFFDQDSDRYKFSNLLIEKLTNQKNDVILFIGEKIHPASKIENKYLTVFFLDERLTMLFLLLNIPLMITFDSAFSKKAKSKDMKLIHLFHSIVSINYAYSNGAFDAYDIFFAVGEHHIKELKYMANVRKWQDKKFLKIGYPKLDGLVKLEQILDTQVKKNDTTTILFAPSWGEFNLLKLHGIDIINQVLSLGYNIIVRPHPNSFRYDTSVIKQITDICSINKNCILEHPSQSTMDSYIKSHIMISDWSGAAYEYAFGLLRPVLFIDVPMKKKNTSKIEMKILPMEFIARDEIGKITNIDNFTKSLNSIIDNKPNIWKEKIKTIRKKYIFNYNNSIDIAVKEIIKLKEESHG